MEGTFIKYAKKKKKFPNEYGRNSMITYDYY